MAAEYVGGVTGGRAGSTSTTTQSLSGTLTGGLDSSPAEGDLIIVSVAIGTAGRTPACAITSPAGYDNLGVLNASDSFDTRFDVSLKFYETSDGTNITIPSTGNTADGQAWGIQVWRGIDPTIHDVTAVSATGSGTSRINPPAITPVTDGAQILLLAGFAASTTSNQSISGDTDAQHSLGSDTNDAGCFNAYVPWTTADGTVDMSASSAGSNTTSDSWACYVVALKPAGSGGGVVDELHELAEDWETGSIDSTDWPSAPAAATVVSGELVLDHDYDGAVPGWPPPTTAMYSRPLPLPVGERVYCRMKPMLTDDNGAGDAHKAWDHFAVMGPTGNGPDNGFGFIHSPAVAGDGSDGLMFCKVFNGIHDEWWVDVGQISSYDADGNHAWLGLRHDASNFYWDTAPDNGSGAPGTWTNRFSYAKAGAGVSFVDVGTFFDDCRLHFRTYHWAAEFSQAIVLRSPTYDGINSPLVGTVTHDAEGDLTGPGSTLAGTAARNTSHGSSGALEGPGAALAGSSAILRVHESDGALAGPGAALAGTAFIGVPQTHEATGALAPGIDQGASLTAVAAITADPDKIHSIQDFFDDGSIDAAWDIVDVGTPTGGITESDGELRINLTSNGIGDGYMLRRDTTKDFALSYIFTRLTRAMIVSNNQNGAEANFGVIDDTDSGYLWQQRSNGTLVPHWKVAGTPNDGTAFAYTPSTHAWLRIKDDEGTIRWQHAPLTANDPPHEHQWVTDYSRTRAADGSFSLASMRARFMVLMSFGTPGVPTGSVRFACLNTRTTQIVSHDAEGDLVGPGADLDGLAAKKASHAAEGDLVGPGAAMTGAATSAFEHHAIGALVGDGSAIILGEGSTSDTTRKVWVEVQDTGGAWTEPAQSDDPWTPRDDTGGGWAS